MITRQTLVLAVAGALWCFQVPSAGAVMLCPDETGAYLPAACDLIWPFEPNPQAIECDAPTSMTNLILLRAQPDDLICWVYWEREMAAEPQTERDR